MSELQIGLLLFFVTFAVLFSGVPIAFGLTAVAVSFLAIFGNAGALAAVPKTFIGELSSFALLTLPMFIVLGAAIGMSRAGKDIYESLHRWLHRVPGGLVIANIFACGLFSAMCGSSPATAAAIGKAGIPQMLARGVPARLATGAIAAGGSLGILIPPSITFIIYGIVTETSIGRLFLAGVLPGVLLVLLFSLYSWMVSMRTADRTVQHEHFTLREKVSGLARTLPFLVIIIAVTVVMYGGFATPSEVAAIAAFLALILVTVIYRTKLTVGHHARRHARIVDAADDRRGRRAVFVHDVVSVCHAERRGLDVQLEPGPVATDSGAEPVPVAGRVFHAGGRHHPDEHAVHPAGAEPESHRPGVVRRGTHDQPGNRPDSSAGRPEPVRHSRHRAGSAAAGRDVGSGAVRCHHDGVHRAADVLSRTGDMVAESPDGACQVAGEK
jgi:hypothetical protein